MQLRNDTAPPSDGSSPQLGWLPAFRYLYRVVSAKDGRDHKLYGYRFIAATESGSLAKLFARFRADPVGKRILANRPPSSAILRDRTALAATPPGSLARCYLEFLSYHGLDDLVLDDELNAVSRLLGEDDEMRWFRHRDTAMHDIRHLVTGYGPDPAGEMCLLTFRYAQMGHPGLTVIAVAAAIGVLLQFRPVLAAVREAYRRGRTSALLDLMEWEAAPEKSLAEYQRSLRLQPPVHYHWRRPAAA
jgi:ubiquinone biosynthesis protein COQ4